MQGTVELDDQVETLQWLGRKFDSLDLNRVGIMGWSYGQYVIFNLSIKIITIVIVIH